MKKDGFVLRTGLTVFGIEYEGVFNRRNSDCRMGM
jgi:hypothetical protein